MGHIICILIALFLWNLLHAIGRWILDHDVVLFGGDQEPVQNDKTVKRPMTDQEKIDYMNHELLLYRIREEERRRRLEEKYEIQRKVNSRAKNKGRRK